MIKQDFSKWWTPERVNDAEIEWQKASLWKEYVQLIGDVRRDFGLRSVVEFGCGSGLVCAGLNIDRSAYLGVDSSPEMIALARTRCPEHVFELRDIRTAVDNEPVDLSCSFAVIKHFAIEEYPLILSRILDPGKYGMVDISVTDAPSFDNGTDEFNHTYINRTDLSTILDEIGHSIERVQKKEPLNGHPTGAERWYLLTKNPRLV